MYCLSPNNFFYECLEDERLLIDSKGLHDVTHPHSGHQEKESQAVGRNGGAAGQTQHLKFQVLQLLLKDSPRISLLSNDRRTLDAVAGDWTSGEKFPRFSILPSKSTG